MRILFKIIEMFITYSILRHYYNLPFYVLDIKFILFFVIINYICENIKLTFINKYNRIKKFSVYTIILMVAVPLFLEFLAINHIFYLY